MHDRLIITAVRMLSITILKIAISLEKKVTHLMMTRRLKCYYKPKSVWLFDIMTYKISISNLKQCKPFLDFCFKIYHYDHFGTKNP